MHRSGTSAITRGLQILGVNLGDTLLPPAFDNPKGFWEDQDILRINEALLAEFQSAYDRVGLLEIDMIHPSPAIAKLEKDAQSVLAQKFSRVDVFAIKDPRLARLLPFWQRAFSDAGLAVAYIIALRNPLSVADSLALRNRFDLVKSSQLWHEHMLTAIHYTQGQQRVVVDYDQMLADPETAFRRITKQLHIGVTLPEELKEYQENFLDRSLRHTYYTRKDVLEAPYLPQGVRDIYPILADCAEDLRDSDDPELFMMVTQQMKFQRGISPVLNLLGRLDHRVTYQDQLLNEQDRERAEVEANLDNLQKSHAETIEELQRLQQRHIEQDRERAEVEANLDNLQKSHAETIEELQRLRAQATELQAMRNSRLWRLRDTIRLEPWSIGKTVRIARLSLSLATPAPLRRRISAILRKDSTAVTLQPTSAAAAVDADFDADFYVKMYPDIAAAGIDPYSHYLEHGKSEGRIGKLPPIEAFPTHPVEAAREIFQLNVFCDINSRYSLIENPLIERIISNYNKKLEDCKIIRKDFGLTTTTKIVSIIIPLYGRYDFVEHQLIEFSRDSWLKDNAEILYVIDDVKISDLFYDLSNKLYSIYRIPFSYVWGERNRGFSGANNLGIKITAAPYIVFLNSDVFPQSPFWLKDLIDTLIEHPEIGAVGPRLLFSDGSIQHAGMQFLWNEKFKVWMIHHPYMGIDPIEIESKDITFVEAVTGACIAVRRVDLEQVNNFDSGYLAGDFEDSDLCLKLYSIGLKIAYMPTVQLTHLERQSFNSLGNGDFRFRVTMYNAMRHTMRWGPLIDDIKKMEKQIK